MILRRRASTRRRAPRASDDSPPARPRERPRSVLAPVTIQRASSRARPLPVLAASTPRASSSLDEDARPPKRWAVADRRPLFFPPVSPRLARAFHLERDARTALKSDDLERARERCPAACAGREDRALDGNSGRFSPQRLTKGRDESALEKQCLHFFKKPFAQGGSMASRESSMENRESSGVVYWEPLEGREESVRGGGDRGRFVTRSRRSRCRFIRTPPRGCFEGRRNLAVCRLDLCRLDLCRLDLRRRRHVCSDLAGNPIR